MRALLLSCFFWSAASRVALHADFSVDLAIACLNDHNYSYNHNYPYSYVKVVPGKSFYFFFVFPTTHLNPLITHSRSTNGEIAIHPTIKKIFSPIGYFIFTLRA